MYEPIGKSTQKYNYDMQEPTTPTASTAEVVSNTAKIPHEPLGIFIFKWIIILLGSSMLGMILVLFGQEIYHNIIVGGETHFREKCLEAESNWILFSLWCSLGLQLKGSYHHHQNQA